MPIVGMGGVTSGIDALELVAAGASAVALGTILFSDRARPGGSAMSWRPKLRPAGSISPRLREASRLKQLICRNF